MSCLNMVEYKKIITMWLKRIKDKHEKNYVENENKFDD